MQSCGGAYTKPRVVSGNLSVKICKNCTSSVSHTWSDPPAANAPWAAPPPAAPRHSSPSPPPLSLFSLPLSLPASLFPVVFLSLFSCFYCFFSLLFFSLLSSLFCFFLPVSPPSLSLIPPPLSLFLSIYLYLSLSFSLLSLSPLLCSQCLSTPSTFSRSSTLSSRGTMAAARSKPP